MTPVRVKADFGKGRVVNAPDALAAGTVDRIATYQQTLARLVGSARQCGAARASVAGPNTSATLAERDFMRRRRHALRLRG